MTRFLKFFVGIGSDVRRIWSEGARLTALMITILTLAYVALAVLMFGGLATVVACLIFGWEIPRLAGTGVIVLGVCLVFALLGWWGEKSGTYKAHLPGHSSEDR